MGYSISVHNGSKVARDHNLRNRRVTDKEEHINKDGYHATWADTPLKEAYEKIFGEAVREYNERVKASRHPELVIQDYLKKIKEDTRKNPRHPVYEVICTIGNYEHHPDEEITRQILYEYYKGWEDRNPGLICVGAYYHSDEAIGATTPTGHLHLDFVPCAKGLTKGMKTQNLLKKALEQQGFVGKSARLTAQMMWQNSERDVLEKICNKYGLEITHPEIEHKKHLNMKEYRQIKRIEDLEKKSGQLEKDNMEFRDRNSILEQKNTDLQEKNAELMARISKLVDKHNEIIDDINELETATAERAEEILETYNNITQGILR